jgi:hypothetical protein
MSERTEPNRNYNKDKRVYKSNAVLNDSKNTDYVQNERKNERDSEKFHKNQKIEKRHSLIGEIEYYEQPKGGLADFSEEYNGKLAKILVLNQPLLIGKIVEVRRYWIKFENPEGKVLYINKAFILTIEPIGAKP